MFSISNVERYFFKKFTGVHHSHRACLAVASIACASAAVARACMGKGASSESYSGDSSSASRRRARAQAAGTERSRCTIPVGHAPVFSSDLGPV